MLVDQRSHLHCRDVHCDSSRPPEEGLVHLAPAGLRYSSGHVDAGCGDGMQTARLADCGSAGQTESNSPDCD